MVGFYKEYGEFLVRVCVVVGIDYVDFIGEGEFVEMIRVVYYDIVLEIGVWIVNCCGYDSIFVDLGVWLMVDELFFDGVIEIYVFILFGLKFGKFWNFFNLIFGGIWVLVIGFMNFSELVCVWCVVVVVDKEVGLDCKICVMF